MDGSWLQLKLKRRRLQRRLHAHLTLLHVYYPWNQIKSILLLNIRITKQANPNPNPNPKPNPHPNPNPGWLGDTSLSAFTLYVVSLSA